MTEDKQTSQRPVKITRNFIQHAEGSVLIEVGASKVIRTATIEDKVPIRVKGQRAGLGHGRVRHASPGNSPAEYQEVTKGKPSGRSQEIQRLIGRALRSVVNLTALGENHLIDCDVIQADGGTRTARSPGRLWPWWTLLAAAAKDEQEPLPLYDFLAATSVGIVDNQPLLDLVTRRMRVLRST